MNLKSIKFPGIVGTYTLPQTASDLDAAPDGYGLGTTTPEDITSDTQLDATIRGGFYRYAIADSTICGISFSLGSLAVYPIGTNGAVQELRPFRTTHCLRRYYLTGTWSEWVNTDTTNFAPNGFGLGLNTPPAVTTTEELDATRKCGFYRYAISNSVICGISFNSASMIVYSNTANSCVQELIPYKTNCCLRRNYVGGSTNKWSDWELVGGVQKLLWENASLTSDFSAQTIALDLSGYDAVYIEAVRSTSSNVVSGRTMVSVGGLSGYLMGTTDQLTMIRREVKATTTGVVVSAYQSANSSTGTSNEIPYRIYGIKGVSK